MQVWKIPYCNIYIYTIPYYSMENTLNFLYLVRLKLCTYYQAKWYKIILNIFVKINKLHLYNQEVNYKLHISSSSKISIGYLHGEANYWINYCN